jgi:hypothetical protein
MPLSKKSSAKAVFIWFQWRLITSDAARNKGKTKHGFGDTGRFIHKLWIKLWIKISMSCKTVFFWLWI